MGEDKLYQYKPMNKFTIINLLNREIRLNSPKVFNDPYDCKILTGYHEYLLEILLIEEFKSEEKVDQFKKNNKNEYKKMIEFLKSDKPNQELKNSLEELRKELFNFSDESFYVSCFTEDKNSMLMWSHYADYHRGICIEYSREDIFKKCYPERYLLKVIYTDENVKFDLSEDSYLQLRQICSTKATCWSYEKEWRIIDYSDKKVDGFNIAFIKPTGIYMGSKINDSDKEFIKNFCNENKINLYQMKLKKDSFNIYPEVELEFR